MTRIDYNTPFVRAWFSLAPINSPHELRPHSLNKAVQAAVAPIHNTRLKPLPPDACPLEPRQVLAIVVYCYSSEIYSSAAIACHLARDLNCCRICQGNVPGAVCVARFRDQNRNLIQHCLQSALRFLAGARIARGEQSTLNEEFIHEEARRRLIMAVCTDMLENEAAEPLPRT